MGSRSFALSLVALVACGPLAWIPGGKLSGNLKPAPSDWSFTDSIDTVQLETRAADPYSVNVWGASVGNSFYIASSNPDSRWALNMIEDPRVRLRLGDDLYEMNAVRTEDPTERDAFLAALAKKYDFKPDPGEESEAALFRLEPR